MAETSRFRSPSIGTCAMRSPAIDAQIVDPARVSAMFPGRALDAPEVTDWLNKLEQIAPLVIYLGSGEAPAWTRKAIRQADMVVFACRGEAPVGSLTEIEAFACQVHPVSARRIVRIHDYRTGEVSGTAAWLARLPCFMHHHVALRGPGRYRQPDPLSVRPRDRIRRRPAAAVSAPRMPASTRRFANAA